MLITWGELLRVLKGFMEKIKVININNSTNKYNNK